MKKILIIILILIGLIIVTLILTSSKYEKFNMIRPGTDSIQPCKVYYEKCTCYGLLTALKSYPPKYSCSGLSVCKSITRDEPVGCSQE